MADYTVFGNPIGHSLSPPIHHAFAEQTGQALSYSKTLVPLGKFDRAATTFQQEGGKGANVTVPFKADAFRFAHSCSPRATLAGAVNTLIFRDDGTVLGDNTDGVGLVRDLSDRHKVTLQNSSVLILGAGGATRGIVGPLLEAGAHCHIANRTAIKGEQLAEIFKAASHTAMTAGGLETLPTQGFDIILNATSLGLNPTDPDVHLPSHLLKSDTLCYDLIYGKPTPFLRWAQAQGVTHLADGLGMLVEQAAEAFFLWRGVRPHTQPIFDLLKTA